MFPGFLQVGEERMRGTKGTGAGSRSNGWAGSSNHPLLWERDSGSAPTVGKDRAKESGNQLPGSCLAPLGKKTKNTTLQMHKWGGSAGEGSWVGRQTSTHMHARARTL